MFSLCVAILVALIIMVIAFLAWALVQIAGELLGEFLTTERRFKLNPIMDYKYHLKMAALCYRKIHIGANSNEVCERLYSHLSKAVDATIPPSEIVARLKILEQKKK